MIPSSPASSAAAAAVFLIAVLVPKAYGVLDGYKIQSLRQEQQRLLGERAALEKQIAELNLRERVRLLGFADRPTTLALFWGCEFFVLSSRIEPFGIVVLEAMAAHKAVLATRSGIMKQIGAEGAPRPAIIRADTSPVNAPWSCCEEFCDATPKGR